MTTPDETPRPWWRTPIGHGAIGFAALLLFYLVTEHTAHTFGLLPYLLLLACPLMHLFMHRGGHGHDKHQGKP